MKIDELRQDRNKLVNESRTILDEAKKEDRDLTAEENNLYEAKMAEVDTLGDKIEKIEVAEARDAKVNGLLEEMDKPVNRAVKPEADPGDKRASEAYAKAFRSYLGANSDGEARALQADLDVQGGYTVVPEQFMAELIKFMDNSTIMRGLSRVISVPNAESLGVPSLDTDPADPTWTGEILTGSEDSDMAFGKRELNPSPLAERLKVSKKLVRASALNIEQLVRERLGYKAGVVEENAFLNGSGSNQPLGVFTASDDGIGTGQDVSTDNATTSISTDGLINAKYFIKTGYWNRARWIFHRDGVKQIRKLKDGNGQYIWKPGITSDTGDTILDIPVLMSEYAPNTFTTGLYVGIIGDFSNYWIADALSSTIQVLTELYAETNQNGYILRLETDGMPVLAEAFARVKLA